MSDAFETTPISASSAAWYSLHATLNPARVTHFRPGLARDASNRSRRRLTSRRMVAAFGSGHASDVSAANIR